MKGLRWLLFLTLVPKISFGQVVINEYSCSNNVIFADNYGDFNDWFELYNPSGSAVNLGGYFLSDNVNNPTKWAIPAGVSITAGGRLIVMCSGRDEFSGGFLHATFKLTQTKPEEIVLANPGGIILDQLTTNPTLTNHSRGRTTDGASTWSLFTTPTPNAANNGAVSEYVARPVMNQAAGNYSGSVSVSITCATAGSEIRYTTDGSEPTSASTLYSGAINISATTVLRARAFKAGMPDSFIESNTYFINVNHSVFIVSVFGGSDLSSLFNGSQGDPLTSVEVFDANEVFLTEASGNSNKHGNDSWAYAQRGVDFVAHDQYGYSAGLEHQFFPSRDRDEFQRVILKPAANDNYPFENGAHIRDAYVHMLAHLGDLYLDVRTSTSCVLYLNGQYWGVYEIREKADDSDFTDHYYDQDEKFSGSDEYIQFLKTWGGTWSEYGNAAAQNDWNALRNYIASNNMAVQANFNYVDSLYNWKSLVDYFCLNSVVVCQDWLNWNTAWWRGLDPQGDKKKWRYVLWDMDATFGHYINYTGIPTSAPTADPCNVDGLPDPGGQGHTNILNDLMANPTFEQYYISRYIDLNNTVFSCANMQLLLDQMIGEITPEMQMQINKWGGSLAQWQTNVQTLKDYIDTRCVALQTGLVNCYNVTGPYDLTLDVDPAGAGTIDINSLGTLDTYPWTATYYGNIDIYLKATPDAANGWEFDYWEIVNSGTITPSTDSTDVTLRIAGDETVIAHFKTPTGGYLPTAFSPNGDGINDVLRLLGEGIMSMNLTLYNRWGESVINLTNPAESWDGTYKGEPVPAGVYAYKLFAVLKDGEEINQSGNITVVR